MANQKVAPKHFTRILYVHIHTNAESSSITRAAAWMAAENVMVNYWSWVIIFEHRKRPIVDLLIKQGVALTERNSTGRRQRAGSVTDD